MWLDCHGVFAGESFLFFHSASVGYTSFVLLLLSSKKTHVPVRSFLNDNLNRI